MNPYDAVQRAGGKQADLWRIFRFAMASGRIPSDGLSKQAVQQWVKRGHFPAARELQLMRLKPSWFRRANGQESGKAKAVPASKAASIKPRRGARPTGENQRANRRRPSVPAQGRRRQP